MTEPDKNDTGASGQLPAQKAMKQFARTDAEREKPEGPNGGPALTERNDPEHTRSGDAGVGESDNEGSSPYGDRDRKEKPLRDA